LTFDYTTTLSIQYHWPNNIFAANFMYDLNNTFAKQWNDKLITLILHPRHPAYKDENECNMRVSLCLNWIM